MLVTLGNGRRIIIFAGRIIEMGLDFESTVFETRKITLGDTEERIVAGGRDLFLYSQKHLRESSR